MFLKRLISVLLGVMALVAGGSGISLAADTGAAADNDKFTASDWNTGTGTSQSSNAVHKSI